MSGAEGPPAPLWRFSQVFGERSPGDEVQDADIISAVEFDSSGEQLATGDRGGRVVLFQRTDSRSDRVSPLFALFFSRRRTCLGNVDGMRPAPTCLRVLYFHARGL